jgi:predicted nucleotidyltransferase
VYVFRIHMDALDIHFTKIELKLVKYIFKHFKDTYNARCLSKILDLNHAHVNKLCKGLVEKNILNKREMGNACYFVFNYKNKYAIKFVEYLFSVENKEIPQWLSVLKYQLRNFDECIEIGAIFGSSIKKDKFNDIDILLIYNKDKLKNVNRIKKQIIDSELIEKHIRYVEICEKDVLLNIKNEAFYNILSENIIFCGAEKFTEIIKNVTSRESFKMVFEE